MFNLNPLGNPDALWQHSIMIAVSAIIGYIIGHNKSKQTESGLKHKLAKLDSDLENCQAKRLAFETSTERNSHSAGQVLIQQDDLQVIEGIGPQIETLLNSEGIYTFQQLSETNSESIIKILKDSGTKFHIHDPHTWPQQAYFASLKMWNELDELKKELKKGRYQ